MQIYRSTLMVSVALGIFTLACSDSGNDAKNDGSGSKSGGASSTGGASSSGGQKASGGAGAAAGSTAATGGTAVTGGSNSSAGGTTGTGGTAGSTSSTNDASVATTDGATGGSGDSGGSGDAGGSAVEGKQKPYRIIWTSDYPPSPVTNSDPDDVQTVIRLILYSNEIEVQGFIAAAGTSAMVANKKNFDKIWAAYDTVYPNLKKHDPRYPTPAEMRAMTYEGKGNNNGVKISWGCTGQQGLIGEGLDSEGSNAIIAALKKDDTRPLWVGVAGGPREVAQAIWDIRKKETPEKAKELIMKLRVFLIFCQDGTHGYIMNDPDLFVIEAKSTFGAFFCNSGKFTELCNLDWVNKNIIRDHGPLGALYPDHGSVTKGVQEGDSPAFMHLVSGVRGINDPEIPSQPGWGGKYAQKSGTRKWLDTGGGGDSVQSGREKYQPEFAERADWMVQ